MTARLRTTPAALSAPPDRIALARQSIERGSKSFAMAARLLDPVTRADTLLLYAWCRHCDDLIDGQSAGFASGRAPHHAPADLIATLRSATRAALAGPVADPIFAGLGDVVRRNAIPEAYVLAHLDGYAMDVDGRRYLTLADTLDYCYAVAGVVGIMMGHILGVRDRATLVRARDLGIGFQLTNIARDIVDDAATGRVYCPKDWLTEAGIPVAGIAETVPRPNLARVAARLLATAQPYYDSAAVGIRALPLRTAWAIATASAVYRDIGTQVEQLGAGAWDRRVSTSAARKLQLAATAALEVAASRRQPLRPRSDIAPHKGSGERPLPPSAGRLGEPSAALDTD